MMVNVDLTLRETAAGLLACFIHVDVTVNCKGTKEDIVQNVVWFMWIASMCLGMFEKLVSVFCISELAINTFVLPVIYKKKNFFFFFRTKNVLLLSLFHKHSHFLSIVWSNFLLLSSTYNTTYNTSDGIMAR